MAFTTAFFDLDDTLYPASAGLWREIRRRMGAYMVERLNLPADQVDALRHEYFQKYGTTLRGLQQHYQVNTDDYLAYVHDLPLAQYLQPNPGLRAMLLSLPLRRFIFTNADQAHALRVLNALAITDCFDEIIDVRRLNFYNKPDPQAYLRALALAGGPAPETCFLLDDSTTNLAPANRLGLTTILVNSGEPKALPEIPTAPHFQITQIEDLPNVLPQLWQTGPVSHLRSQQYG